MEDFLGAWATVYIKNYNNERERNEALSSHMESDRQLDLKARRDRIAQKRETNLAVVAARKEKGDTHEILYTENLSGVNDALKNLEKNTGKFDFDTALGNTGSQEFRTILKNIRIVPDLKTVYADEMIRAGYSAEEVVLLRAFIRPAIAEIVSKISNEGRPIDLNDSKTMGQIDAWALEVLDRAGSVSDLGEVVKALEVFWRIQEHKKYFSEKYLEFGLDKLYVGSEEREAAINRLANDAYNRNIPAERIRQWFGLAQEISLMPTQVEKANASGKKIAGKPMDFLRALYEADSLMRLGIAESVKPLVVSPEKAGRLFDDLLGFVFKGQG
ncbi:MAG TPA: hypothetical protein VJC03_07525, partial [bacterium]|nr:hypothetical protein [bacterium]